MASEERASRSRRSAGDRALCSAECEIHSPGGVGIAPASATQVDDAHVLQRSGGDLPGIAGRSGAVGGGASAVRAVHRAALPLAGGSNDADLYGRLAFLRG